MKKLLIVALVMFAATTAFCQKSKTVEVLYFKANLSCCAARSCNALEAQVKQLVESDFDGKVSFVEVKLDDANNKELVDTFHATSQTLGIVNSKGEMLSDASAILKQFARSDDKDKFKADLTAEINKYLK